MAMTINTNISSLNAQRNLSTSQSSLSTSMQRLSSGMRINSAKDDAAGLAIATRMGTQITGLNQAARNANDGVSLAQTAEGALSSIGTNLQRIRELAVQSRNATNSAEDREALQKEVTQLKSEIDRVAKDTSFNGTNLLDGSFTSKAFQVGANQGQLISIDGIQNAKVDQLGSWTSVDKNAVAYSTSMGGAFEAGEGEIAVGALALGNAAGQSGGVVADFKLNVGGVEVDVAGLGAVTDRTVAQAQEALADNIVTALTGKIPGLTVAKNAANNGVEVTNSNGQSYAITSTNTSVASAAGVTAAAKHEALDAGELTINGKPINVAAALTDSARAAQLAEAINTAFDDGSVKASVVGGNLRLESAGEIDIEVDAGVTSGLGLTTKVIAGVKGTNQTGFADISVATAEGADDTIVAMDAAIKAVNSARADLGAIQNRFESVVSNLSVNSENLSASKSRIMDADFASETANLSRSQVLQQAGTAMVAQANQLPQGVLSLLR